MTASDGDKAGDPGRSRGKTDRSGRAHGRELALLALCHLESYREDERAEALEIFWAHAPSEAGDDGAELRSWFADPEALSFARRLLEPVLTRSAEVDAAIASSTLSFQNICSKMSIAKRPRHN